MDCVSDQCGISDWKPFVMMLDMIANVLRIAQYSESLCRSLLAGLLANLVEQPSRLRAPGMDRSAIAYVRSNLFRVVGDEDDRIEVLNSW